MRPIATRAPAAGGGVGKPLTSHNFAAILTRPASRCSVRSEWRGLPSSPGVGVAHQFGAAVRRARFGTIGRHRVCAGARPLGRRQTSDPG